MSVKPKIRLDAMIRRKLPPIQQRTWTHNSANKVEEYEQKEYEQKQPQDTDELDMLISDLEHIKTKKSLECFITENRDFINNLDPTDRNCFLGLIKRKYY